MAWDQLELTGPHLTYLILSTFLISYALFSEFIRNTLHLSEPPLAVLIGILFGPSLLNVLSSEKWGLNDNTLQETTRIILGIQCFAVGIQLPRHYIRRHWKSVAMMLGPVMAVGWIVTSLFAYLIFGTGVATALIIGACLSPTDPVLAASVLSHSRFSTRVPKRLKEMLLTESGCNDGVSFPFLYAGLVVLTHRTAGASVKDWFLITLLWQCVGGTLLGVIIGICANHVLRFSVKHDYIGRGSFVVFYLLLAILCVGLGSTLGSDDFLIAFGAGIGFADDGWFSQKSRDTKLPNIIDLLLNSTIFVYFGTIIPWNDFSPRDITPYINPGNLFGFFILVLALRRIPIVLAMKRWVPDIRTYREALFCGHFGPMGVGALFLAMEARAQLETGTSLPKPQPPEPTRPFTERERAIEIIWPVICFVVMGSTFVHGLSVAAISVGGHYTRKRGERAPLIGAETDGLDGMVHSEEEESELELSEED